MNEIELRKLLGAKVRQARKAKRLSQAELAKRVGGWTSSFISQIELGRSGIPGDSLADFARELGIDEYELTPESLSPEHYKNASGYVTSPEQISLWRNRIALDRTLSRDVRYILMTLAAPEFLNDRSWMTFTRIDEFAERSGEDLDIIRDAWPAVVASPYLEQEKNIEWAFWLKFPE